ncbi:MAG TPA: N-6 DNA methylase [Egibacteraceae bacterium]|nr:N-6 DNA methylase [Egibacteraceae bacterium]
MADRELERYVAGLRPAVEGGSLDGVLGGVAAAVACARGVTLAGAPLPARPGAAAALMPPPRLARPELLGQVYEALRPRAARRTAGAFYTPEAVARALAAAVLDPLHAHPRRVRVADPAVGGGAFLLAAARHLCARGADARGVVLRGLYGVDVDPTAVAVTRTALAILAGGTPPPAAHVRVADALGVEGALPNGLDAVVGNPPFLSQLAAATARSPAARQSLRARFGEAAGGYADTANLFLLLGLGLVRDGGRVGLVLPDSFLVARDAGPARRAAAAVAALEWLWLAGEPVFAAGVRVCAPVFAVGRPQRALVRRFGPAFAERHPLPLSGARLRALPTWGGLGADLLGVPAVDVAGSGTLGDHGRATAGFRDEYYGLIPYVFDGDGHRDDERRYPRLLTTGLIDPARSLWGVVRTRFAKQRFTRPRVDVVRLRRESPLGPWSRARLVPKVLVATQTRVLEAVADPCGEWLPSTPTITVETPAEQVWHLAAALNSPPLAAVALRRHAGAALSPDAITLSARHVAALPAPTQGGDWDEAAAAVRAAAAATTEGGWRDALEHAGRAMCLAYRVDDPDGLLAWWSARLPPWRSAHPAQS